MLSVIGGGLYDQQAAECLGLSLFTVNTHRKAIMAKTKLHHKGRLILYALQNKYLGVSASDSMSWQMPERSWPGCCSASSMIAHTPEVQAKGIPSVVDGARLAQVDEDAILDGLGTGVGVDRFPERIFVGHGLKPFGPWGVYHVS